MPPKKDAAAGVALLTGFTDKETKLLAAAFVGTIASDKYDYEIMAAETGNTAGSLKKMWPPVKKKAIEKYATLATFLGGSAAAAAPKTAANKKRKAADEVPEEDATDENDDAVKDPEPISAGTKLDNDKKSDGNKSDAPKSPTKKAPAVKKEKKAPAEKQTPTEKKAPAAKGKGRPKKAAKKEEPASDEEKVKTDEESADGGDGLGGEVEDEV